MLTSNGLAGEDVYTILHIISLSVSSGALHGKKPQDIASPLHNVPLPDTSASSSTATSGISNKQLRGRLKMLENDLVKVTQGFSRVSDVTIDVSMWFKSLEYQAYKLQSVCKDILLAPRGKAIFPADQLNAIVEDMAKVVSKLKSQIPSTGILRVESVSDLINHLVNMSPYQKYRGCLALLEFEERYKSLDLRSKECLFCFSAFPEGYVVDKTLLMYWWVGEELIDNEVNAGGKITEEFANEIVKHFVDIQFVEPVTKNGKLVGLRMPPIIRYAVAYLAEQDDFFDFDFEWNTTSDFRSCGRGCLMETADDSSQQKFEAARLHPGKLRSLFNVNKRKVDIGGKWFRKITNVKVLVLGVLDEGSYSIGEVTGIESLKWLKHMKDLKFLGLGGIDTPAEFLGDIGMLQNLRVLTLKKWQGLYNLSLGSLTHLEFDYSPDYNRLPNPFPKAIRELTELRVLKGFHTIKRPEEAKDFATLDDLVGLNKLRKLTIVVWIGDFPLAQDLDALCKITSLQKLTIVWPSRKRIKDLARRKAEPTSEGNPTLPQGLRKLYLRKFPMPKAPFWLTPSALQSLKKLYIRKGDLQGLGENDHKWKVKILRLIDLPKFNMDWSRVKNEFPDLIYLEKIGCSKLTSFRCDANGVWLNKKELKEKKKLEELGFSWSFLATCPPN